MHDAKFVRALNLSDNEEVVNMVREMLHVPNHLGFVMVQFVGEADNERVGLRFSTVANRREGVTPQSLALGFVECIPELLDIIERYAVTMPALASVDESKPQ